MRAPPIINPIGGVMAGGFQQVPLKGFINLNEINTAVLDGEYTGPDGQKVPIDIRMIYHAHGSRINQLPNTLEAIEAHRKVEFVVTQRSEEHTSELQSLMRSSYAVFCLTKKKKTPTT